MAPHSHLQSRQGYSSGDSSYDDGFYSFTAYYVRYAVVAAIFILVAMFVIGGYYHARRRIRQGLPPRRYHRWLVRHYLNNTHGTPRQQQQQPYGGEGWYGRAPESEVPLNGWGQQGQSRQGQRPGPWAPPPPAYEQWDAPPVYVPPPGASKASADQHVGGMSDGGVGEGSSGVVAAPGATYNPRNEHVITQ